MAEETLLDRKLEDGEKLIQKLQAERIDVTTAGWVQEDDGGFWYLYIASNMVDSLGEFDSYKKLYLALRRMPELWIDPFEIKLIGTAHPMAKEILELQRRYPAKLHTRYRLH